MARQRGRLGDAGGRSRGQRLRRAERAPRRRRRGPPETLVRTLHRGDVLGELALLSDDARSASVRARRDVALLELGRESFENLVNEAPGFALGLARGMGAQLAASRAPLSIATPPRTIAVIALDPAAPDAEVVDGLAAALGRYG